MSEDQITPFSKILSDAFFDIGIYTCRGAESYLVEKGCTNINFRRISDYKSGYYVPPFEKANAMLKALAIDITAEDLEKVLEYSREKAKQVRMQTQDIKERAINRRQTIVLKFKEINPNLSEDLTRDIVEERIVALYEDKGSYSKYVNMLIKKDLEDYILQKGDITNG